MCDMNPDVMDALAAAVRRLRNMLEEDFSTQLERRFRMAVSMKHAGLDEKRAVLRRRLETWLRQRARARSRLTGVSAQEARSSVRRETASGMASRTLLRLVLLRQLEAGGVMRPAVLTGGWESKGYVEFREYAPQLLKNKHEGYDVLLQLVFDELAVDLPGLYRKQPTDPYFTLSPAVLREVIVTLDADELKGAWQDDTALGWVYQFWNDPQREAIDKRVGPRGKIAAHEVASKTQLFTERYMVEWLLQNSVGRIASSMQRHNGSNRDQSAELTWPLFVKQGPGVSPRGLPTQLSELRILDPACGSGHFLAGAFDLLVPLYIKEARDAGRAISGGQIADQIIRHNLHGVDIDRRAVQVAAAVLYLKARKLVGTSEAAANTRIPPMNLVATSFDLDGLAENDPAFEAVAQALPGRQKALVKVVEALRYVSFRGSLIRFETEAAQSPSLFTEEVGRHVERFIDEHARADDLGVHFDGTQLAAGLRLRSILQEERYDVVVFNPPYLATSKIDVPAELLAETFGDAPDLFAAFVDRAFELCKPNGLIAFVALSNWMFLSSFQGVRRRMLDGNILLLADLGKGAFRHASKLIQTAMVVATPSQHREGSSLAARIGSRDTIAQSQTEALAAELMDPTTYHPFEPTLFSHIEGTPLLFWLDPKFMRRYLQLPKVGDMATGAAGIATTDNGRYLRATWEVAPAVARAAIEGLPAASYVPYIKGAAGQAWIEPCRWLLRTGAAALELRVLHPSLRPTRPTELGVAYTTIGHHFAARLHAVSSVRDVSGASFFPGPDIDNDELLCALNRSPVRAFAAALNPTVNFQQIDVRRLPFERVDGAAQIVTLLRDAFAAAQESNERSLAFTGVRAHPWRAAQRWAQQAIDRPAGMPLPSMDLTAEAPAPWLRLSQAVGVALGRLLQADAATPAREAARTLPDGILFLSNGEGASLKHPACEALCALWKEIGAKLDAAADLSTYLRKGFFAEHKRLYDGRPIYFPLSSSKRNFVAYVSIHRWHADTLQVLLAEYLLPEQRRLTGQLSDLREARQERRAHGAAEQNYIKMQRLAQELSDFIKAVTEIADKGPPQPNPKTPPRQTDARYLMDLDDGVVVNSAALWPLLLPQWKDPKKWWQELASAKGRKDYDWSHLAARYFPERVAKKCRQDASLAVAHKCLWQLFPKKAYAWELRLQDEICPGFSIDEANSAAARERFLREHPDEAGKIRAAETKRRKRKAAKDAKKAATAPPPTNDPSCGQPDA